MNGPKTGDHKSAFTNLTLTGDLITKGDMVYQETSTGATRPASAFTWDTDLLTTQTAFKLVFAGVALNDKPVGSVVGIRVGTDGDFEFDQASGTKAFGALVGPAKASGNALENQKVATAVVAGAIGRCNKAITVAGTKIRVRLKSTVQEGAQT